MELYQMEYFAALCKCCSFTRAAEALHVTQPTVTVAIQKLENELGVSLFERRNKELVVTPIGLLVQKRVATILNEIENIRAEVNEYRTTKKEVIKLGMPMTICAEMLVPIYSGFMTGHPQVELLTTQSSSEILARMVDNNELDMACILAKYAPENMECVPFHSEELFVCFPKHHRLAALERVSFTQMLGEPLLFGSPDAHVRKLVLDEFGKLNLKPRIAMSCRIHPLMVRNLVSQGVGVAFLTRNVVEQSDVDYRPLDPSIFIEVGVVWRKSKVLTRAQRELIDFIIGLGNVVGIRDL